MPARKFKRQELSQQSPLPDREPAPAPADLSVRLASTYDEPFTSPVQSLTARLERELGEVDLPRRWPLAVSAPLWIGASGLLWFGIIKTALTVLHR